MTEENSSRMPDEYNEKHAVAMMKLLNFDRKEGKLFCDKVLHSEGKEFPVHKCILGVMSPFFQRLFTTEMQEKYDNVVNIQHLSQNTLDKILDYIYTGVINVTEDNVYQLVESADYTQIPGLTNICKTYLLQVVSPENCLQLRVFAQLYRLDEILQKVDETIAGNFVDVLNRDEIKTLDVDTLTAILSSKKHKHEQYLEEATFSAAVAWTKHNPEGRAGLFLKLLSMVDLSLLSGSFLNRTVKIEPFVFNSFECLQHLVGPSGGLELVKKDSGLSVVSVGGQGNEKSVIVETVDFKKIERLPVMNQGRLAASAIRCESCLYVIGGRDAVYSDNISKSVEYIDLIDRTTWMKAPDMFQARIDAAAAVLDDVIYVCGGFHGQFLSSCEKYETNLKQWTQVHDIIQARYVHGMAALKGQLYCVGGYNGGNTLASVERYDLDSWKEVAPMNEARQSLAVVSLNGCLYAIGGISDDRPVATVEKYDPVRNVWTIVQPLNMARFDHGACVQQDRIYVFGGRNDDHSLTEIEAYDEESDTWMVVGNTEETTWGCTLTAI